MENRSNKDALVAQLDRALPSEGRGQRFESSRVRQFFQDRSCICAVRQKLNLLVDPMRHDKGKSKGQGERVRAAAARLLLDRGLEGKLGASEALRTAI